MKKACERCGKVYLDPKALRQHVKQVHERSRQLHCVQCEFIFSSKYALSTNSSHVLTNSVITNFIRSTIFELRSKYVKKNADLNVYVKKTKKLCSL